MNLETNSSVDKKIRRRALLCSYCPPNRKENRGRIPKYGEQKPKGKTPRR